MYLGGAGISALLGADCKCGRLSSSFASFHSNQLIVSSRLLGAVFISLFAVFLPAIFFLHLSAAMACMVRWLENNCNKMIHDLIPSFKSLMAYVLPSQMLLPSPFPPFFVRLSTWICAGCDEGKIGPCFWFFQWLTTVSVFLLISSKSPFASGRSFSSVPVFASLQIVVMNCEQTSHVRLRRCFWHHWEDHS